MAVLVYVDNSNGKIPKSALEAVFYAGKVARDKGAEAVALVIGESGSEALEKIGNYGVKRVLHVTHEKLQNFDSRSYTKVISEAVLKEKADTIVFAHNYTSKSVAPRLSAKLKAGLVAGVVGYPEKEGVATVVKRTVYAGKAFAYFGISTDKIILAIQSNAFSLETTDAKAAIENFSVELSGGDVGVVVKEVNKATDKVPLTEAPIVVSGGRGLKGPENWKMLEDLADALGAALACSKPVADMHWRPHAEHVGQTGITVRPNLYMAIGISGAIQHLAGINGSKYIIAVNKDPEAPIFKAADYGIVGDAFEVVPKIYEAVKKLKA